MKFRLKFLLQGDNTLVRQSVKGTIYSYVGVIIGFINTGVLFPNYLSEEQVGLVNLLVSISVIYATFANLGFNNVITRLFPYFRSNENNHNGFLLLTLIVITVGLILSISGFFLLKPIMIRNNLESSPLFVEYLFLIPILTIGNLFFLTLDTYSRALFNASFGTFLQDIVKRIFISIWIALFIFNVLTFTQFIVLYSINVFIILIALVLLLIKQKNFSLQPKFSFLKNSPQLRKKITDVSLFGIITSFSGNLITRVDIIMVNSLINLSATGIYTVSVFFSSLVAIPFKSANRILSTQIAEAWRNNDIAYLQKISINTSLYQTILGLLLFFGIWINLDSIYTILPDSYRAGKYVIFFIGLTQVLNMVSGVNGIILTISEYYRYQTYLLAILGLLVMVTNWIFIPRFGISGAALATLLSNIVTHLIRFIFLYKKFGIFPLSWKLIIIFLLASLAFFLTSLLPDVDFYINDILIKSLSFTLFYFFLLYTFKISDLFNQRLEGLYEWVIMKIKK